MTDETSPPTGSSADPRVLDADALKGLAHPMRVAIYDLLSTYGPNTATGIAERIGESSGVASYHLRQLAKHHLVREIEGRGTARERWWERTPGAITLYPNDAESPGVRAATASLMRHWQGSHADALAGFIAVGEQELPERWLEASSISTANLRLTSEQALTLADAWEQFSVEHLDPLRNQDEPGARPVQVQFNLFPIIDGVPTPSTEGSDR